MKNLYLAIIFCLALFTTRAQNYALNFNGSSQYINIPDQSSIELSASFTIEGWVYPTGVGSDATQGGSIINKENSYEIARFADGTLQYALSANGTGGDWTWINTSIVLALNKWTHISFVKLGTAITIYINGVSAYTNASAPAVLIANTQALRIGNRTNAGHFFNGNMDELRIWNTARTQTEIKTNMLNRNLANNATGLVAYYRMNENAGTTTASASTNTSGLTGTLVGTPTWSTSPIQFKPNSLSFDGVDDVVTIPYNSSLDISTAITLEAWVYATKTTGIQNVISKSNATTNTGYIFPRTDDGWANVNMYLFIGGAWKIVSAAYPSMNAWHHLAATYDGATMKLYIDGILKNSVAQTGLIATNTNALSLGNQIGFSSEYFGGAADEMRIWNVARTQAQIQAAMNAEFDPAAQTGLVSYYTLNQGITAGTNTGLTTVFDQKGNNTGTLSGFANTGSSSNFIAQYASLVALPVSWLNFTAEKQNNNVLLNWSTASEQNNAGFTVQHSIDANSWVNIGSVQAVGNSSVVQQYYFTHTNPSSGINYYRIMQQDQDGKFSYSKVISINYSAQAAKFSVYPNPVVSGVAYLQLQQPSTVLLYNSTGRLVATKQFAAGKQSFNTNGLAKGIYYFKVNEETVAVTLQ
ncbi:MAG: T9SS type A sorting domain-containing protein [Chitinophagaceae bacterium]